jgi:hypothetical protein
MKIIYNQTCVPDLEFDFFTVDFNGLYEEVDANGGGLSDRKRALAESPHETGLAHAGLAYQHHFEQEFVVVHSFCLLFVKSEQNNN